VREHVNGAQRNAAKWQPDGVVRFFLVAGARIECLRRRALLKNTEMAKNAQMKNLMNDLEAAGWR
jgi:hypothetical protein